MDLILTMAGKYSRFRNEGYKFPKYLLPWGNRTILSEIINEFKIDNAFDNIYLIANIEDEEYKNHLKKILEYYSIPVNNIFYISDTTGQAETAFIGINKVLNKNNKFNSVCFHNIDTIIYNRNIKAIKNQLEKNSGYIDIFYSNNPAYSYVSLKNDFVDNIVEKKLISNLATSGFYGFSSYKLFLDNYNNQLYISELYKKMLAQENANIVVGNIYNNCETIVLGTPEEYKNQTKLL